MEILLYILIAALLIYNGKRRQHVNKSGFVCHGSLDQDAIDITVSWLAANSTFGKLKCPFCTLLISDSRHHVLLIVAKQDVSKWMKSLVGRADSAWKINGFMIDDAAAEVDPIRQEF
ncbi:hypothetical protein MKW98_016287 [Papaver atlanticum]|uniref:Uncharacterized protein n=1 Tax=Papaver atlanticum TaxID=357466 RepID=A0AAD4SH54_9MAGN|nr:hypothetical protein MKW98_016287 [Papaver atlanticum]